MKFALILFILFCAIGFSLSIAAVWLIFDYRFALVAGAACSFLIAGFIKQGLTNG